MTKVNYLALIHKLSPFRQNKIKITFKAALKGVYLWQFLTFSIPSIMNQSGAEFIQRHIGPNPVDSAKMLKAVGVDTLAALIDKIVPANIRLTKPMEIPEGLTEFEMLQSLSGKTHEVITSVCFKTKNSLDTITETTKVTFNSLSDEAIRYYIETYKPFDKAGSYGIQEWIGLVGIAKIEGSYTNVVGLPVDKVYQKLIHYVEIY